MNGACDPRAGDGWLSEVFEQAERDWAMLPEWARPVRTHDIEGWECPRCHAVHAPSVASCSCQRPLRDRIGSVSNG